MAGNGGLYCLGCGENLVGKKPYERRVLYTLHGKKVKDSWKELLTSTGTVSVVAEIDLDQLIGTEENLVSRARPIFRTHIPTKYGETKENPQFMCRSCFEKYKTLAKLRSELVEKAERALAKMNAVPNTSRRKRNCTALEQPTSKRLSAF